MHDIHSSRRDLPEGKGATVTPPSQQHGAFQAHHFILDIANNFGLLALLVIVVLAVTIGYVSSEHAFYFWDSATYPDLTVAKALALRDAPRQTPHDIWTILTTIRNSTANDYSDLYTLPLVPSILLFGDSRLVYIASLALLYLVPFILVIGAISTTLLPAAPRVSFWLAVAIALLIPATWTPTLRGYPDTGAAALIGIAVWLYLRDPDLHSWWRIGLIGVCLALAPLLRRHFLYDCITFFVSVTSIALITTASQARRNGRAALHGLLGSAFRIACTALATLLALAVLGWPFIDRVLTTKFDALYASYKRPVSVSLAFYQAYYGWIIIGMAVLGLVVGWGGRTVQRRPAGFVLLFVSLVVLEWMLFVGFLGDHYTLHFTPWIVLAVVICFWNIICIHNVYIRLFVGGLAYAVLALNMVVGLAPWMAAHGSILALRSAIADTKLFAQPVVPIQQQDYAEIARLVDYLHDTAKPTDLIYVAASSPVFNSDLLWHAHRVRYEQVMSLSADEFGQSHDLTILQWPPTVDSRDELPLEKLLRSQYVVIATPFQYHLPQGQNVVGVVVAAFTEQWPFARDFQLLPTQFMLSGNVQVQVYKRLRPTAFETALQTLQAMQLFVGKRPGRQPSWINVNDAARVYVRQQDNGTYRIDMPSRILTSDMSFLYLDGFAETAYVSGRMIMTDQHCSGLKAHLLALDLQGQEVQGSNPVWESTESLDFSGTLSTRGATYLLLTLSARTDSHADPDACWVGVQQLAVKAP